MLINTHGILRDVSTNRLPLDGLEGHEDSHVGREYEVELLKEKVKSNYMVGVCGDALFGKSSIVDRLCFDLEDEGHKIIKLKFYQANPFQLIWSLPTELYKFRPLLERALARAFKRPGLTVFLLSIVFLPLIYTIQPAMALFHKIVIWAKLPQSLSHIFVFLFVVLLPQAIVKAIDYETRGLLTKWAEQVKPAFIGREEKHIEEAMKSPEVVRRYVIKTLSIVCKKLKKKLIIKIDDIRNLDDGDRDWLFDLIQRVGRNHELKNKVCFLLAWRIPYGAIPEFIRPYFNKLSKLSPEDIAKIFEQEGVKIEEDIKPLICERVKGSPGIARMVARAFREGDPPITHLSHDNINDEEVRRVFKDKYDEYLRRTGLKERQRWLYELIAIIGPFPLAIEALDYLVAKLYSRSHEDITKGIRELKEHGILRETETRGNKRYEIIPDSLREFIYEQTESITKFKAHKLLAKFYRKYFDKVKHLGLLMAIAWHAERTSDIQSLPDIMKLELWARKILADAFYRGGASGWYINNAMRGIKLARELNLSLIHI